MRTRTRARGRPPAPRDSEPRRGLGLGDNSLATSGAPKQMELSDSISTGRFPFYCCCFSAICFAGTKGVHRKT